MTALQITYLVILGVCILASGFFSGSETALFSIPRERVELLAGDDRRARRIEALVENPDTMLGTLLVANNFVNILGASVATVLFVDLMGEDWGPWVSTGAVTAVILVIGEITPKSLAARFPEKFSLVVAGPIWRLSRLIRPVSRFFLAISRGLLKLFRVGTGNERLHVTEEDIRAMAVLGERTGQIASAEREIIDSLFRLEDQTIREVMTPRTEIRTLASPVTIDDVRSAVSATGHSRFPVIKEDLDHLIGVLYVKDLIGMTGDPSPSDIHRVIRTPTYVPESKSVLDLLIDMRARRLTFAVVTDEHGGNEGIVTIKDLISELVGEIQDEYDQDEPPVIEVDHRVWIVDGRTSVEDLEETIEVEIPDGEFTTIAGLVLERTGRIPVEGDTVELDGIRVDVVRMDRNRVDRVRVSRVG